MTRQPYKPPYPKDRGKKTRKILVIVFCLCVAGYLGVSVYYRYEQQRFQEEQEAQQERAVVEKITGVSARDLDKLCGMIDSFGEREDLFVSWLEAQPISDGPKIFACLRRQQRDAG